MRSIKQRNASIRNIRKAQSRLSEMMHEAANTVLNSVHDSYVNLGDRGAVLDLVDISLCGKAMNSPVLKNWMYKLILNGMGIESLKAA